MSPKGFFLLLLVTLATVAGAVAAVMNQPAAWQAAQHDAPVFPLLEERLNDLAKVEVVTAEGSIVVERVEDAWTLPGQHGYPARDRAVRDAVLGLKALKVAEPKTRTPEGFKRLRVEDLETEGARSRLVRLSAGDGTVLAEALLGRSRPGALGQASGGLYYRKPGEAQAWLAAGEVELPETERAWMQNDVVHLPSETVASLEVAHADGSSFRAARATPEVEALELEQVPEGREVATSKTDQLDSALSFVAFKEVAPAADIAFAADPNRAVVTTFDGVEVTVELGEAEGELWAKVAAALAANVPEEGREAAEALVREITDRTSGWAYQLDDHVVTRLLPKTEQFLQPEPKNDS